MPKKTKKSASKPSTAPMEADEALDDEAMDEMLEDVFQIQKIYTKDVSYEAPNTPDIFRGDWRPEVDLDVKIGHTRLAETVFEVILTVTATVKLKKKLAFLIEVQQAGIFTIAIPDDDEQALRHALGSFCPTILFPYLRAVVADLVVKGGFPQLDLHPINFDLFLEQEDEMASDEQVRH